MQSLEKLVEVATRRWPPWRGGKTGDDGVLFKGEEEEEGSVVMNAGRWREAEPLSPGSSLASVLLT